MKKVNFKLLNLAFWVELVLSYVLPFRVTDDFGYQVGFPFPFIAVYDTAIGVNPLVSMHLNPLSMYLYFIWFSPLPWARTTGESGVARTKRSQQKTPAKLNTLQVFFLFCTRLLI